MQAHILSYKEADVCVILHVFCFYYDNHLEFKREQNNCFCKLSDRNNLRLLIAGINFCKFSNDVFSPQ